MPRATDERGRDGAHRRQLRVGAFRIDAGALQVQSAGRTTRLTPKAMGVLLALAREPGVTLSRDELLDRVWGSVHVTPGVVGHAITALRRAFGDDVEQPAYIETIPRVGYRLVAEVEDLSGPDSGAVADAGGTTAEAPAAPRPSGPGEASHAARDGENARADPAAAPQSVPPPSGQATPAPAARPAAPPAWRRPSAWLAAALALAAFVAVVAAVWPRPARPTGAALTLEPWTRVTFAPGSESTPRLSPSGDWLVYSRRERVGARPGLFLQSLHGTEPIALDEGEHAERPAWSPDGREIAYVWRSPDGARCEIRATGVDGPDPLKLADCPPHSVVYLDWSPAVAGRIAYSAIVPGNAGGTRIRLLRRAGGWATEPFDYGPDATPADLFPRFSPDGRTIAFRRGSNPTSDLYSVAADGGPVTRLTTLRSEITGLDWLPDGSGLVFSSNHEGPRALYLLSLADGRISPLGIEGASAPDIDNRDGNIAFQLEDWHTTLAEVPLQGGPPRRLAPSSGSDFSAAFSQGDQRVVFVSNRDGSSQLWLLDQADGRTRRLTRHTSGQVEAPVLSADGRRVLYVLRTAGRHELHEFDFGQGVSQRVAVADRSLRKAIYGGDDHSIWYTGWDDGAWRLHACPRTAGQRECRGQATPLPAFRVERTRIDGRQALLLGSGDERGRIAAVAEDDLQPLPIGELSVEEPWRAVDGAIWALQPGGSGEPVLVEYDLRDGRSRRLATLDGLNPLDGEGFDVSADRRRLVLPVVSENRTDIGVSRLVPAVN